MNKPDNTIIKYGINHLSYICVMFLHGKHGKNYIKASNHCIIDVTAVIYGRNCTNKLALRGLERYRPAKCINNDRATWGAFATFKLSLSFTALTVKYVWVTVTVYYLLSFVLLSTKPHLKYLINRKVLKSRTVDF